MAPSRTDSPISKPFCALLLLALLGRARAAPPVAPLTSFEQIWALPAAEQKQAHRVSLDYTVYYYDPVWRALWGKCGDQVSYLSLVTQTFALRPGELVRIEGSLTPAAGMRVGSPSVTVLAPPAPLVAQLADEDIENAGRHNGTYVEVTGLVDHVVTRDVNHLDYVMICSGRSVYADVLVKPEAEPPALIGSEIRVRGVYYARSDPGASEPRIELWVQGFETVERVSDLDGDPHFDGPATAIDRLASVRPHQPVRVAGIARSQIPGQSLVVLDPTGTVRVDSAQTRSVAPGTAIEAVGLVDWAAGKPVIKRALYRVPLPLITTEQQFFDIPDSERMDWRRAKFEFVVNDYDPAWNALWGRNGDLDSYLTLDAHGVALSPGERILVEGRMRRNDGTAIFDSQVTVLEPPRPLEAVSTAGAVGASDRFDKHLVTMDGLIDRQLSPDAKHMELQMDVDGRLVIGRLYLPAGAPAPALEGCLVHAQGVYSATNNPSTGIARIELWLQDPASVTVTGSLSRDPRFNLPLTTIEQIPDRSEHALVHLRGLVRAQEPGRAVTIRDETGQMTVRTVQMRGLAIGETIDVIGFASARGSESLIDGAIFRRSSQALPAPGKRARLRLAEDVRNLSPEEAAMSHPVRLDGVVTWANPAADFFFLRDASGGAFVSLPPDSSLRLMPGVRVRVQGVTAPGRFTAVVMADRITRLSTIDVPPPKPVTLEQALTGVEQAQWVSVSGFVHQVENSGPWTRLTLSTSAGDFSVRAPLDNGYANLVGSVVTVTGVCDAITNARRQLTGIQIWTPSLQFFQVDEAAPADPFSVPARSIAALRQFNALQLINRRVRVAGDVVNRPVGGVAQLQDGAETLRVVSRDALGFEPGDRIEAVGFAGQEDGRLILRESICRVIGHGPGPRPLALTQVSPINSDLAGRLVRIHGRVVDASTREVGLHLLLQAADGLVDATLPQSDPSLLGRWPRGSRVSVTGVYMVQFDEYRRPDALQLLLRAPTDVEIVARAPWLTIRRVLAIAGIMAAGWVSGLAWVLALRRRVRFQTAVIHEQVSKEKAARLDAALTRASKLESLGVLAGGIAHDFNNLLTVIMGNCSLARLDEASSSETHSLLDQGVEAAKQARGLTQQLLTFAKGGAPVRRSESLAGLAREAAAFALHGTKSAREFIFDEDLWSASVDRTQIGQVIHNLVINADQAMPQGGQIRIELHNRQVAAGTVPELAPGRYVELVIADTGPGIPPEQLSRIFEPYFTTKPDGSGLGLATVHSIIKRHKGHIAVASAQGQGTTFRLWLPAAAAAQANPPAPGVTPVARAGRVLFMDDEAPIRKVAAAVLRRMGIEVVAVADGAAAVNAYRDALQSGEPFDVVILDLTVPGGTGGTAAMAELRRLDPQVKAIASSGYSSDPVMANHVAYGFSAVVPKPYQVDDLMKAVSGLMKAGADRREPVPAG